MSLFKAEYTDEALSQLRDLEKPSKRKIIKAISIFEDVGTEYKNINDLGNGLFELKPDNVRAYFKYHKNKLIIVGFITLKKTQKAPQRYIEQANRNIENYIKKEYKNEK
jgi:phage-related protein